MNTSIKIILIIAASVAIYFISTELYHLRLQLWGDWVWYLFNSAWLLLLLLWSFFISPLNNSDKLLSYSVLGGILLAVAFPPLHSAPLMFIALLPMLYVEQYIALSYDKTTRWTAFKFAFVTLLTWNILSTWWVANSSIIAGIIALLANSALLSIPFVLYHTTKKRLGANLGHLSLIAYWLAFEFVHLRWDFTWTWLNLGNAFASTPQLVQWYEYTGYSGGSLWILVVNILLFRAILYRESLSLKIHWVNRKRIFTPLIIIALPILFSLIRYYTYTETGEPKEVVVVQPNFEPHFQKFTLPDSEQLPRYRELMHSMLTPKTDYVVFPETSFDGIWLNSFAQTPLINTLREMTDSVPHLKLITGLGTYKQYTPDEPRAETAHHSERSNVDYESYNSAEQFTSGRPEVPHYFKSKLVPGIEKLPYFQYLGFMAPLTAEFGGISGSLGIGKPDVFWDETHRTAIAPLICYESIFGELATEHVAKGANAFFIMTNDGWWDNTAGYRQHLQFASLRAIETRRDIARSANTGTSCFINQRGDLRQTTEYGTAVAIRDTIYVNKTITLYAVLGDVIARIGAAVALFLWLFSWVTVIRGKRRM